MGQPAAILGDRIQGTCAIHLIPNPVSGIPQPGPPVPFSAPVTTGVVATVQITGKPAVVMGNSGINTPPHVGLHPADPFMAPPTQQGNVIKGSATVLIGGQPAARMGDQCTCCGLPVGTLMGTGTTVLIGG
jgi:uncharacterized Zn-binding protein involved in type VI secretion